MTLYVYLSVLFVCLVAGLYSYRGLPQALLYVFWLVVATVIIEGVGLYHLIVVRKTAGWFFCVYQIFEFTLLSLYYRSIITSPAVRQAILFCILIIALVNVYSIVNIFNSGVIDTHSFLISAFFITVWSVIFFLELVNNVTEGSIKYNPNLWISTGVIFFYAGSFFQMGFTNMIYRHSPEIAQKLYVVNHLLNCIYYGMVSYGFLCQVKYRKLS